MPNNPYEAAQLIVKLSKHTNNTPFSIFMLIRDRLANASKVENYLLDMD